MAKSHTVRPSASRRVHHTAPSKATPPTTDELLAQLAAAAEPRGASILNILNRPAGFGIMWFELTRASRSLGVEPTKTTTFEEIHSLAQERKVDINRLGTVTYFYSPTLREALEAELRRFTDPSSVEARKYTPPTIVPEAPKLVELQIRAAKSLNHYARIALSPSTPQTLSAILGVPLDNIRLSGLDNGIPLIHFEKDGVERAFVIEPIIRAIDINSIEGKNIRNDTEEFLEDFFLGFANLKSDGPPTSDEIAQLTPVLRKMLVDRGVAEASLGHPLNLTEQAQS